MRHGPGFHATTVFDRCDLNPLLTVRDLPFRAASVLNPGAAEHDGQVVLLLRVEDVQGYSAIHVARSADGVHHWQIDTEPLLRGGDPRWTYEAWGCEDPRVTYVAEEQCWYIIYVAYSHFGPAVALARTTDFKHAERIGLLGSTNDKDGALLPRKFNGEWAILHRPDAGGAEHIWSSYSVDLVRWGNPHCVLPEGGAGPSWNGQRVGTGPPPIETDDGWLLIYHGVKRYGDRPVYRVGLALLDRERPHKLIGRSRGWVFQAEASYEMMGLLPNVVFPTGALLRDDHLWMYYGAADTAVCLATAHLPDLLNMIEPAARDT